MTDNRCPPFIKFFEEWVHVVDVNINVRLNALPIIWVELPASNSDMKINVVPGDDRVDARVLVVLGSEKYR